MNRFTISSKKHGKVEFYLPRFGLGYILVMMEKNGAWSQICRNGRLDGNTLQGNSQNYEKISRKWFRNYCRQSAAAE